MKTLRGNRGREGKSGDKFWQNLVGLLKPVAKDYTLVYKWGQ